MNRLFEVTSFQFSSIKGITRKSPHPKIDPRRGDFQKRLSPRRKTDPRRGDFQNWLSTRPKIDPREFYLLDIMSLSCGAVRNTSPHMGGAISVFENRPAVISLCGSIWLSHDLLCPMATTNEFRKFPVATFSNVCRYKGCSSGESIRIVSTASLYTLIILRSSTTNGMLLIFKL